MSPTAIETALDSHEDELSRTAIDIGTIARRLEQLELMEARILELLQHVPELISGPSDATTGAARAKFLETIAALRAELPREKSAEALLTAEVRHPEKKDT